MLKPPNWKSRRRVRRSVDDKVCDKVCDEVCDEVCDKVCDEVWALSASERPIREIEHDIRYVFIWRHRAGGPTVRCSTWPNVARHFVRCKAFF